MGGVVCRVVGEDASWTNLETLRSRRKAIVRRHMESENAHDFDVTIGTFSRPRYELVPSGTLHDGEAILCERVHYDTATILRRLTG